MKSSGPWIKWFPGDFLGGVTDLYPAELAVYVIVLNLIYDAGGPVEFDEGRLARRMRMRPTQVRDAITTLVRENKLKLADGFLSNDKAMKILGARAAKSEVATENAQTRWRGENENAKENKGGENAAAKTWHATRSQKLEPRKKDKKITNGSSGGEVYGASGEKPPAPKADKRGSRIPPAWIASKSDLAYAEAAGFDLPAIREMEDAFFDFWKAKPGQGGTKLDWPATWRTWVRTEAKRRGGRNGPGGGGYSGGGGTGARGGATPRQKRIGSMLEGAVEAVKRRGGR